jgi:hypothetical protein
LLAMCTVPVHMTNSHDMFHFLSVLPDGRMDKPVRTGITPRTGTLPRELKIRMVIKQQRSSRREPQATTPSTHGMALEHGASFEPDEHLAALVLRHVGDLRDCLALECVSRMWRAVGQTPGVWQSQDLAVSGALAARLTDARFRQVLRRAGPNLRSLVINDASTAFTGVGLRSYAALVDEARGRGGATGVGVAEGPGFSSSSHDLVLGRLQTLDLRRCPGVTGRAVLGLLTQLRIHDAPKVARCRLTPG